VCPHAAACSPSIFHMSDRAHLVQLTIRLKFGTFSTEERRAIVEEFRNSELGQVRIDEAIVTNLGIGGPGGLPVEFDIWLTIIEGAAGALLATAIASGIAPVIRIVGKRIVRLVAVIHKDEGEPVTYIADPNEAQHALDAMPADYEETIRSESHTRIWRAGRWERQESNTRIQRGGGS
jgi:hypothetical protein